MGFSLSGEMQEEGNISRKAMEMFLFLKKQNQYRLIL